jgi:hypothetical protein
MGTGRAICAQATRRYSQLSLRLQVFRTRIHATGGFRQESSLDDETLGDPMCNSHSHLRSVLRVFSQVAQKTPPCLRDAFSHNARLVMSGQLRKRAAWSSRGRHISGSADRASRGSALDTRDNNRNTAPRPGVCAGDPQGGATEERLAVLNAGHQFLVFCPSRIWKKPPCPDPAAAGTCRHDGLKPCPLSGQKTHRRRQL